jgi:hypothetical protein
LRFVPSAGEHELGFIASTVGEKTFLAELREACLLNAVPDLLWARDPVVVRTLGLLCRNEALGETLALLIT